MKKKQIAGIVFALWLMTTAVYLIEVHVYDLEIFFVVGFIGFLIILELLEPQYLRPGCLRYKNYLLAAGIVIFFGIASQAVAYFLGLALLQF